MDTKGKEKVAKLLGDLSARFSQYGVDSSEQFWADYAVLDRRCVAYLNDDTSWDYVMDSARELFAQYVKHS